MGWVCLQSQWFMWESRLELRLGRVRINGVLCVPALVKQKEINSVTVFRRPGTCSRSVSYLISCRRQGTSVMSISTSLCDSLWELWAASLCHSAVLPRLRHQERQGRSKWMPIRPLIGCAFSPFCLIFLLLFSSPFFPSLFLTGPISEIHRVMVSNYMWLTEYQKQ